MLRNVFHSLYSFILPSVWLYIQEQHEVDANTGKVIETEKEKLDKEDMAEYRALMQAKVTLTSAMQKATQSVNGKVIGVEFELEKGQALYDIEVVKDNQIYDVSIDANTGKVLSSQVDMEDDG